MSISSYFKIRDHWFFFDHLDAKSAETAWGRVAELLRMLTMREPDTEAFYQLVSAWRRPVYPGPWSVVCVIGETPVPTHRIKTPT